jgi:hypothetical protein
MKIISIVIMAFLSLSCVDAPEWPNKIYTRIHNNSGKNLTLRSGPNDISSYTIANKDSVEFRMEARYRYYPMKSETIYIDFEDGKKLIFQRSEFDSKNFFDNKLVVSQKPKKGKYRNDIIDNYYITPLQYDLAK